MQFQDGKVPIAISNASEDTDAPDDERMWYVRLRIRDDHLAKLWVWKLAEHDVIAWSEPEERWKKLLAIPQLRAAVRKATTSAFVRKKSAPPPAMPESRPRRRFLQRVTDIEGDEATVRFSRSSYPDLDHTVVDHPASYVQRSSSAPPPANIDPMLRALTTTIPPAASASALPQFPRAPRVPSISELAQLPTSKPNARDDYQPHTSYFRSAAGTDAANSVKPTASNQSEVPPPRAASAQAYSSYLPPPLDYQQANSEYPLDESGYPQARLDNTGVRARLPQQGIRSYQVSPLTSIFSVKNISWALMPVACAGVFAIFLDRYIPYQIEQAYSRQGIAAEQREASAADTGTNSFASVLEAMTGMSIGTAEVNAAAPTLTPEQLARVTTGNAKSTSSAKNGHTVRGMVRGPWVTATKVDGKEKAASGVAQQTAAQGSMSDNGFDKEGARTALQFAAARARNCSNSGMSGTALITFGPSGTVQKVQVTQLVGDDVDTGCVNRALSGTRVPPFTGAPVTVRKSF